MNFSYKNTLNQSIKSLKLLTVSSLLFCAGEAFAQNQQINLPQNQITIKDVFKEIEKQTKLSVGYNHSKVSQTIEKKVSVNSGSVQSVLEKALQGTGLTFSFDGNHIVITPASVDTNQKQGEKKQISGRVVDAKGEPVIGATIMEKGTTNGTITDFDGNFVLNAAEGAQIEISYIGYKPQLLKADSDKLMSVVLKEDTETLEEVVVVGYGTQKKVNLTGSVATISAENISTIPVSNISNAMAGRMPGIFSYNKSGMPGTSSPITIRGVSTPNNTNPTYVIDGVIREKDDFDAIDPNTIENISVLKDAASAAVYGSRASNGVIVVSTKRGLNQKPKFSYSGLFGTECPTKNPETMNAYNRTIYLNNKFMYNEIPETDSRYYTSDEQEYFKTHDTNWRELAWRTPFITQHNLSVNGGSEKISYYMSIGYFNQTGTFNNLDFQRYTFRSNVDAKITNDFSIGLDVDGNMGKQRTPYWPHDSDKDLMNDMYRALLNFPRTEPAYINGRPNATIYNWNILEAINNGHVQDDKNTLNTKLSAKWNIPWVKGLTASGVFNYRRYYSKEKQVGKEYTLYIHETTGGHNHIIRDDSPVVGTRTRTENGNFVRKTFDENSSYTLNLQLNYNRTFGKHDVGAMFLYEQYEEWGDLFWGQRKELLSSAIEQLFAGNVDSRWKDVDGHESEVGRLGYVGRLNYAFDNRYLIEANFRYDSSVKWIPGKRWGFFPSVSAGWRITEEQFFKRNEKLKFINNLKLRGSYGTLGNDGGSEVAYYQYLSKFNTGTNVVFGTGASGILPGVYPSRGITWETTTTGNVGFDLGLWHGLLSFEFDYFHKRTSNILMARERTIPGTFGASLPKENYAEVVNEGCELVVRHDNKIKDFTYYVSTNFSFARNHYTKIDEAANAYEWQLKTGRPINFITGYIADGIARTDEDLVGLPKYNGGFDWSKGDIILKDMHGPGGVGGPDGIVDGNDLAVLSEYSKDPEIIYGISLGGEWKGLDFTTFFQGVAHRDIMFANRADTWTEQTVLDIWSDAYSPDNIDGQYPRVGGTGSVGANSQASTFWLMNGNYFRCKNIEIGYTFPKKWMNSLGIDRCRIYASGTNLFVFDHIGIYDPENNGDRGAYQYPITKSFNFGVNVTF